MNIRAVICDFDGTLVLEDLTDRLCALAGKGAESRELNKRFHLGELKGLEGLVRRINFLTDLTLDEVRHVVSDDDFLRPGVPEFFQYLRERGIVSIIASGSIVPLLEIYQKKLGVDYIVGSKPKIADGRLAGIAETDYSSLDFKVNDCRAILESLDISHEEVVAIGDSPADKGIFGLAEKSIAIDPKGNIAEHANYVVRGDMRGVTAILDELGRAK